MHTSEHWRPGSGRGTSVSWLWHTAAESGSKEAFFQCGPRVGKPRTGCGEMLVKQTRSCWGTRHKAAASQLKEALPGVSHGAAYRPFFYSHCSRKEEAPNLLATGFFTPRTPQVLSRVGTCSKSATAIKPDSLSEAEHLWNCVFLFVCLTDKRIWQGKLGASFGIVCWGFSGVRQALSWKSCHHLVQSSDWSRMKPFQSTLMDVSVTSCRKCPQVSLVPLVSIQDFLII